MTGMKAKEQSKDSKAQDTKGKNAKVQDDKLDARYGKIGISAVAGAIRHKAAPSVQTKSRFIPADSD